MASVDGHVIKDLLGYIRCRLVLVYLPQLGQAPVDALCLVAGFRRFRFRFFELALQLDCRLSAALQLLLALQQESHFAFRRLDLFLSRRDPVAKL